MTPVFAVATTPYFAPQHLAAAAPLMEGDAGTVQTVNAIRQLVDQGVRDPLDNAPTHEAEAVDLKALYEAVDIKRATAQRIIAELLREGSFMWVGEGKKGHPFLYFAAKNDSAQPSSVGGQK